MASPAYDASDTIYVRARRILIEHPEQRVGQAFYNAARQRSTLILEEFDAIGIDPFDNDGDLPLFLLLWHHRGQA